MDVQNQFWTPNLSHLAPDLGVQDLSWAPKLKFGLLNLSMALRLEVGDVIALQISQ